MLSQPEQVIFLRERLFALPLRRFRPLGDPTRHLAALTTLVSRAKDEDVSPQQYRAWAEARLAAAADDERARRRRSATSSWPSSTRRTRGCWPRPGSWTSATRSTARSACCASGPRCWRGCAPSYRFVLVDEFQDTNHAQLEMLKLLAGEQANLTVVGDDDQAIYRWRGAAAANLLAFRRLYPGAREVVLTENYRSTQVILDTAARLVSYNNPYRLEAIAGIDKRLRSPRAGGLPVRHERFDTVSAEADGVAALIEERIQKGSRPRDFAILVRSNGDADPFLRALNVKGLPHRFSGSRGLYAREEVRLLVSFLRVLANPDDSVSALLPRRLRGLPDARGRSAAAEPLRPPQDPPAARGAARPAGERGPGVASRARRARPRPG